MNLYYFIKIIHVSCAVLSFSGFILRGYWMLQESEWLQHKISRVLPHLIDTVLLVSAIALVIMSRQYPTLVNWVSIKIGLLLLYIVLGSFTLKRGRTRQIRIACLVGALLTIVAIFVEANLKISY
ncbi:MAG: SirB2 family protein [Gammaproteobacteria bacterium]|nr:SirB2 family protein [Gammaproteobacteria bacterium]MDP6535813.1 SirB2 family protein [Gammaproteobacteria bacterium]MDP6731295.1 SirB2 family protein [Gammaproteobacteria bacterium]